MTGRSIITLAAGASMSKAIAEALADHGDHNVIVLDGLAEHTGEIGPSPDAIRAAAFEMASKVRVYPKVPRYLREERHHPTSPRQRGGR